MLKNGFEDVIKVAPEYSGGYDMPDEFRAGCRGNVAFMKILSNFIKDKEIATKSEMLGAAKYVFERLTGVEFSLDRDINKKRGSNPNIAFSQVIYDLDPTEEGQSWGYVTLNNWLGEEPFTLDYIAERYGLK